MNEKNSNQIDKTSMLYWYPIIADIGVLVPQTYIISLPKSYTGTSYCGWSPAIPDEIITKLYYFAEKLGYPLFLRTDYFSAKHHYKDTCLVEKEEDIIPHILNLIDYSFVNGILPINAFVLRKFLTIIPLFYAFDGKLPICNEIRCFIDNNKLICSHFYWVEDAIELPSDNNYKKILKSMELKNHTTFSQIQTIVDKIASKVDGYWSIDLIETNDGWYVIDMAEGYVSWHPEDCTEYEKRM